MSKPVSARIVGYRGANSAISAGIRWWTHSQYSHVAVLYTFDDRHAELFEAVEAGFIGPHGTVSNLNDLLLDHHPGPVITDIKEYIEPLTPEQLATGLAYLRGIVGQRYDVQGIASFVTGGAIPQDPCRVFCSEATMEWSWRMKRPLQNMLSHRAYPDHCMISPLLRDFSP